MWTALAAVADTLERMASGTADPTIYLSSLDPGVGKTATYIHFLRELLASPYHRDVSALVCISRREQIAAIVEQVGLLSDDFAVLTADPDLNKLGCGDPSSARILFTTHRMVEQRCRGGSFQCVSAFHYRGRPRAVRIWDEAILPGQTLTVERYALALLLKPLSCRPALASDVERLFELVGQAKDGDVLTIEDLAEKHGITLNEALSLVADGTPDQQAAVEALWFLFGKPVSVRKDGTRGNTILDYRDTLPDDIKPLLALDASVRVRSVYLYWEEQRGGVQKLPPAVKRYEPLTIYVWKRGGGRTALRKADARLAEAVANTIMTRSDEDWLIIAHKDRGGENLPEEVRALLPEEMMDRVHFLHWGAHDATNQFAHVPNVILAGTLFFPQSYYEALGRMAAARHPGEGPFSDEEFRNIMLGEHRHLILQAICRGAVRRCDGERCPPTRAYIIASGHSGIAQVLPDIFPGAKIERWKPLEEELRGKAGDACRYILERLDRPGAFVPFRDVMAHLGWRDRREFKRSIRRHAGFCDAMAAADVEEWGPGRWPSGFRRVI
ncbi:MAG TPA: hypothetical protein VNR11_04640 [Xanthobacteraceae bacterium]|nr:hypothetical protein [Xanthobacteraceae bacterium]